MASSSMRQPCVKCPKALGNLICGGCQQWLCTKHFTEHQQELGLEMDQISQEYDDLHQEMIIHDKFDSSLFSRINSWEEKSIEKIRQVAEETRCHLRKHLDQTKIQLETSLHHISRELQISREMENYTEIELNNWMKQLKTLRYQLENPLIVDLRYDTHEMPQIIRLIELKENHHIPMKSKSNETSFSFSTDYIDSLVSIPITITGSTRWKQNGITIAGNGSSGKELNQLCYPFSVVIDNEETLFIVDYNNNRIIAWKKDATNGTIIVGDGESRFGKERLNGPIAMIIDRNNDSFIISEYKTQRVMRWSRQGETKILITNIISYGLAIDDEGSLYVSDWNGHVVRRYRPGETCGTIVAGGNGQGRGHHQLDRPWNIFIDRNQTLYVVDRGNHRVMKWLKNTQQGIVVAAGQGIGNDWTQLDNPSGIFVDRMGSVYVADTNNHRVMRWTRDAKQGYVIVGGNGQGSQMNQLNNPLHLTFDDQGNLFVVDYKNHRIQRFDIEIGHQ